MSQINKLGYCINSERKYEGELASSARLARKSQKAFEMQVKESSVIKRSMREA